MINFSRSIKTEIIKNILILDKNEEHINYLLYGLLVFNHEIKNINEYIELETSVLNIELIKLFKTYFKTHIIGNSVSSLKNNNKKYQVKIIMDKLRYKQIFDLDLNFIKKQSDTDIRLIMIGFFINYGSILDPKRNSYHLEIRCINDYIFDLVSLILNKYHISFHFMIRYGKKIIYIKKSEMISDFLKLINCNDFLYYFENCRIEKDIVNNIQRLNNLEIANINKKIKSNQLIIKYILEIKGSKYYYQLNPNIKTYCDLRLKFPDLSMNEILEKINSIFEKKYQKVELIIVILR